MTSDKASGEAILPSIFLLLSLLDREPPLLGEDSDLWGRPRRERGSRRSASFRISARVHLVWSVSVSKFARAERY
jgi:hypothetical protein